MVMYKTMLMRKLSDIWGLENNEETINHVENKEEITNHE